MNIFILDNNPEKAAIYQCNKHIVKMPLEATQMLCTVFNLNNVKAPYKSCHIKHPCTLWLLQSMDNIDWLLIHTKALFREYTIRYNKQHKSEKVLDWCIENKNKLNISYNGLTSFAQAMPEQYKNQNAVIAYRTYYINDKLKIAQWPVDKKPEWVI